MPLLLPHQYQEFEALSGILTMFSTGRGCNTELGGCGNPGILAGYSALKGGSGPSDYILPPNITVSGGGSSSGFVLTATIGNVHISSIFTNNCWNWFCCR